MKPATDYATMPFYIASLKEQASQSNDGSETNADIVSGLLKERGFTFVGHLAELYPHVIGDTFDYPFERYLVLENKSKERIIIFDNETMTREIEVLCDGSDESVKALVGQDLRLNVEEFTKNQRVPYVDPNTYFPKFSDSFELSSQALYERKINIDGAHLQLHGVHQVATSSRLDLIHFKYVNGFKITQTVVAFEDFVSHYDLIHQVLKLAHEADYSLDALHDLILKNKADLPAFKDHYSAKNLFRPQPEAEVPKEGYTDQEVDDYFKSTFERFELTSVVSQEFTPSFTAPSGLDVIYDSLLEVPGELFKISIVHKKTDIHQEETYSFKHTSVEDGLKLLKEYFKVHGLPKNPVRVAIILSHFCEDMNRK